MMYKRSTGARPLSAPGSHLLPPVHKVIHGVRKLTVLTRSETGNPRMRSDCECSARTNNIMKRTKLMNVERVSERIKGRMK